MEINPEMSGPTRGTLPNLLDAATLSECVFERGFEGIGGESEGVQKVAFTRSVGAHQKVQRSELDRTRPDALVVLKNNPL
jgi:hypothetical protein